MPRKFDSFNAALPHEGLFRVRQCRISVLQTVRVLVWYCCALCLRQCRIAVLRTVRILLWYCCALCLRHGRLVLGLLFTLNLSRSSLCSWWHFVAFLVGSAVLSMSGFEELKARVHAVRFVLDGQRGKSAYVAVSKVQAAAFASMLSTAGELSDVQKADLTNLLVEIAWADSEDLNGVLQALTKPLASAGEKQRRRRSLQDFTAIHGYMTEEFWQKMQEGIPQCNKLHILLQAAVRLGLRLPSEHTSKWLACLWMSCSMSPAALLSTTPDAKQVFLKHLKHQFEVIRRTLVDPPTWIEVLPTEPLELARAHPALFGSVFGQGRPVVAPIDMSAVIALSQSFGCRGGLRTMSLPEAPTIPRPLPSGFSQPGLSPQRDASMSLERMANMFVTQMQSMAASQNKLLELMWISNSTPANAKSLRSLTNVHEVPFVEDRQRRQLPALPALVEELVETPPPKAAASLIALGTPPPGGDTPAAADRVPTTPADPLESMLDALASRAKERASSKGSGKPEGTVGKKGKKPKATAGVAAVAEPVSKVAHPKPVAAASKAKKPKVAAEPVVAAPKAKKPKVAAEPAVALPVKPSAEESPSAAVAKAKAKAAVAKMSKPDIAAAKRAMKGWTLGCAKCRWSLCGCGQCRSESFTGVRWNALV